MSKSKITSDAYSIMSKIATDMFDLGFDFSFECIHETEIESLHIKFQEGEILELNEGQITYDDKVVGSLSDPEIFGKVKSHMVKMAVQHFNG